MDRRCLALVALLLTVAGALSEEEAADRVVAAFRANDAEALRALAGEDDPDPWLVADELCARGEHEAAAAFASAAPRKAVERLPAYVAAARAPNAQLAAVRKAVDAAADAKDWKTVLEAADGPLDRVDGIRIAHARGKALREQRRYPAAEKVLRRAAAAARELGWIRGAAAQFKDAGLCALRARRYDDALGPWRASLELAEMLEDRPAIAAMWHLIGMAHDFTHRNDEAVAAYQKSFEMQKALGNDPGVAYALCGLGLAQMRRGRVVEALAAHEQCRDTFAHVGDKLNLAKSWANIAKARRMLGRYGAALAAMEEAATLFGEIDDSSARARVLVDIGSIYNRQGRYDDALAKYAEATAIYEAAGDKRGMAHTLNGVAIVKRRQGRYAEALTMFERAFEFMRASGDRAAAAATLHNIGVVRATLGQNERAMNAFQAALALQKAMEKRPAVASTLRSIANLLNNMRRYEEAIEIQQQALAMYESMGNRTGAAHAISGIGNVFRRLNRNDQALEAYERSYRMHTEVGDRPGAMAALSNAALAKISLGRVGEAEADYRRLLELIEESPDRESHARIRWGMAKAALARDDPRAATDHLKRAVVLASGLAEGLADEEGAGARDMFFGLFREGLEATLASGDAEAMTWFLEQGRAGSLRAGLGNGAALRAAVVPAPLNARLEAARTREREARVAQRRAAKAGDRKKLRAAAQELAEAQAALEQVEARIQREARAAASIVLPAPDDLETIRGYLAPGDALVAFGFTDKRLVAQVVRPGETRAVDLGSSTAVNDDVDRMLLDEARWIDLAAVAALRARIAGKVELSADTRRVLVSPVERLGYVPFALLFPGREVVSMPSGTVLGLLRKERHARGASVLAIGDPDYGHARGLAPLPETRAEVEAIGTVKLLGEEATVEGVVAALRATAPKRLRAVHFACHGLVDPDRPLRSSLALTATPNHTGFLTCMDVFRMKIPADLVVLSACETARGKVYKAEGIIGFTRAFMMAGAPRVIVSLWKVDDKATQALMVKFYELWSASAEATARLPTATALRKAQEHVASHAKWSHPYYWAAWQLWGLGD